MTLPDIYVPAGSSGHGNFTVDIDPQRAGWAFSGLRVLVLEACASQVVETGEAELLVLPLAGGATVEVDEQTFELEGRRGVFSGVTDYLYVGRGKSLTITSARGGRFAFPSAIATRDIPVAYYPKSQVRIDLRGAGDSPPPTCWPARSSPPAVTGPPTRPTSTSRTPRTSANSKRSTTSKSKTAPRVPRALACTAPTAAPAARSTCAARSTTATSPSCPTATTAPASQPPATTCTTSTSWQARTRTSCGSPLTTRPTTGSARPGKTRKWTPGCP